MTRHRASALFCHSGTQSNNNLLWAQQDDRSRWGRYQVLDQAMKLKQRRQWGVIFDDGMPRVEVTILANVRLERTDIYILNSFIWIGFVEQLGGIRSSFKEATSGIQGM